MEASAGVLDDATGTNAGTKMVEYYREKLKLPSSKPFDMGGVISADRFGELPEVEESVLTEEDKGITGATDTAADTE